MKKYTTKVDLELENKDLPLYLQIAEDMLGKMSSGTLKAGDMLPPTREWAAEIGVSRKTIVRAVELLLAKGVVYSKERRGLYVSAAAAQVGGNCSVSSLTTQEYNGREANAAENEEVIVKPRIVVNDGFPDTRMQPFREYSRAYRKIFNRMAQWRQLGYDESAGVFKFRTALCNYLWKSYSINAREDELAVVRGSQMALFLIANAVLSPGDVVALESPGYGSAREVFTHAGVGVVDVPVDRHGIDTDCVERLCHDNKITAIYVTPRFQYPTTVTMSMARRQKLRDLSQKYGFIIIEDDFGANYTFTDHKLMPLSSMVSKSRYIYIGTFSKIFAPGIRLGYVSASADTIRKIVDYRALIDIHGDTVLERAMLELLENGDMKRHIKSAVKTYKERMAFISKEICRILGDDVDYTKPVGGLAVWIGLGKKTDANTFHTLMRAKGIDIPVFTLHDGSIGVRIGYASMDNDEITDVLNALRSVITEVSL